MIHVPSLRRSLLTIIVVAMLCGCSNAPTGSARASGGTYLPVPTPPVADLSTVPARVHVEAAKATTAWIGPAGGTLTAEGPDGAKYELDVPPLAVRDATPITIAPITSVDELGLSGGLAGGVYLGPAGTKLAAPATLTITTSKTAPDGTRLVGFDMADDGKTTDLVPITTSGRQLTELVFHFSAPGAAFGSAADLAANFRPTATGQLRSALTLLLAEDVPWGAGTMTEAYAGILAVWSNIVQPELTTVADDAALQAALTDWREFVFMLNLFAHHGDMTAALADGSATIGGPFPPLLDPSPMFAAGQELVGTKVSAALDGNKALCASAHDLGAVANVWYWAGIGAVFAPTTATWAENAAGCAALGIAVADLPTTMTANATGTVFLQFAMAFADGTKVNVDVDAKLTASGFIFGRTGSVEASDGVEAGHTLQEGVSAQAAPPYHLAVDACWSYRGLIRALCQDLPETFGAGPTAPPLPTQSAAAGGLIEGNYIGTVTYPGAGGTTVSGVHAAIGGSEATGDIFLRPGDPYPQAARCQFVLSPAVTDLGGSFGHLLPGPCSIALPQADAERVAIQGGSVGGGMLTFTEVDCTIFPDPAPRCVQGGTWVLTKIP